MTPMAAILVLAFALGPAGAAVAGPGGPDLQENVDGAIDAGVDALLKSVEGPAGWMPDPKFGTGYAALAVYALVKSDVSYLHPVVQKGIGALEAYTFEKVYSVSLYLMAYDAMIEQIDADARLGESRSAGDRAKFLDRMKAAMEWLVAARLKGMGAWNYEALPAGKNPKTHRYDHSNTQFAVLALGVAAERKLRVDPQVWQEIADHFIAVQDKEGEEVQVRPIFRTQPGEEKEGGKRSRLPQSKGQTPAPGKTVARKAGTTGSEGVKVRARGWKYLSDEQELAGIQGRRRQFSMVCAGLSSLLLAQRNLPPASHSDALKAALRDGFGWLSRFLDGNRRPGRDFYAFYSLEKVGDIGEVAAFGDFDWYAECAQVVIRSQRPDGGWRDEIKTDEASARAATCLALLFLDRATDLGARSRPLVVTRAGGGDRPVTDRGFWIYLPSLKGDVSAARLFRLLRYRPGKQVLKLAEEAVKVHDRERTADIVRPLAATLRLSPYDNVKALAKKLLVQAAGVEFDAPKLYEEWALRLEEVVRIGKASDKAQTERLREMLSGPDGPVLKARVAWALQRVGDKGSLGALIELLEDKDPAMREAAYQAVTFLSGKSLPFHPKGSEKQRVDEVQAWRVWLAGEKAVAPPSKPPDPDK